MKTMYRRLGRKDAFHYGISIFVRLDEKLVESTLVGARNSTKKGYEVLVDSRTQWISIKDCFLQYRSYAPDDNVVLECPRCFSQFSCSATACPKCGLLVGGEPIEMTNNEKEA